VSSRRTNTDLKIAFCPGDIVIDVGAHVGMFSIYLAKRFPFLSIFAFEPEPTNFNNLLNNLGLNRISNVVPRNIALTKDSRPFSLIAPIHNSGGASGFFDSATPGVNTVASSETLESVFESNRIEKCKLLKMDCEGAEHEVLLNTKSLSKVEWLSIEIHVNKNLEQEGYSRHRLVSTILRKLPAERLAFHN
jgi:FkbM family methyltransferase